jgi:hypothetical protein
MRNLVLKGSSNHGWKLKSDEEAYMQRSRMSLKALAADFAIFQSWLFWLWCSDHFIVLDSYRLYPISNVASIIEYLTFPLMQSTHFPTSKTTVHPPFFFHDSGIFDSALQVQIQVSHTDASLFHCTPQIQDWWRECSPSQKPNQRPMSVPPSR